VVFTSPEPLFIGELKQLYARCCEWSGRPL
jgi:hypothetical protein